MLGSKMPMSMLGKIWDLADQDKDGQLDRWAGIFYTSSGFTGVSFL